MFSQFYHRLDSNQISTLTEKIGSERSSRPASGEARSANNTIFKKFKPIVYSESQRILEAFNLTILIETEPGFARWEGGKILTCAYGEIIGHITPEDYANLDCYVNLNNIQFNDCPIYRVLQLREDGHFDEWKFILGCWTIEEAKQLYIDNCPNPWMFGDIFVSSLEEIAKYSVIQVLDQQAVISELSESQDSTACIMVESLEYVDANQSVKRRAKKAISRICPPDDKYGLKVSGNSRAYYGESVINAAKSIKDLQSHGVRVINRYQHVDDGVNRNEPVSIWEDTYINDDNSIFILDTFLPTPKGIEYAERVYLREKINRSWEVGGSCDKSKQALNSNPYGLPVCYVSEFDQVVWLDRKRGDYPGFGEVAEVLTVIESVKNDLDKLQESNLEICKQLQKKIVWKTENLLTKNQWEKTEKLIESVIFSSEKHCCENCNSKQPDLKCLKNGNNSVPAIKEKSGNGVNIYMSKFVDYAKREFKAGRKRADITATAKDFLNATPDDLLTIHETLTECEQKEMMDQDKKEPKKEEWPDKKKDDDKDKDKMDESALQEALKLNPVSGLPLNTVAYTRAMIANPLRACEIVTENGAKLIEEKNKKLQEGLVLPPNIVNLNLELEAKKQIDVTIGTFIEMVADRKKIGTLEISDEKQYPLEGLNEARDKTVELARKRNFTPSEMALTFEFEINKYLENLQAKHSTFSESQKLAGTYQKPTVDETNIVKRQFERIEKAELQNLSTPGTNGDERLNLREGLKKHLGNMGDRVKEIVESNTNGTLVESAKYLEKIQKDESADSYNFLRAMRRDGLIKLKESVQQMDASVLALMPFISKIAIRRIYEEVHALRWASSIGREFFTPYTEDNPLFGKEYRYPMELFNEPNQFLPKVPLGFSGKMGYPGVSLQTSYTSLYSYPYGIIWNYEEHHINALRFEPNNMNVIGSVSANLGGFWARKIQRLIMDEMDNQARRFGCYKCTEATVSEANQYVAGNEIYVNGKTLRFPAEITGIIRLEAGADQDGFVQDNIQGRIIVRPTPRHMLSAEGQELQLNTRHEWKCTLPAAGGGGAANFGRLTRSPYKLEKEYEKVTPHVYMDENHGLLLCTAASGISAGNMPTNLEYWANVSNVTRINIADLVLVDGMKLDEASSQLVLKANGVAAGIDQNRQVKPSMAITSAQIGRTVISNSTVYQNNFGRAGATLNGDYTNNNDVANLGYLDYFASNMYLPGGNDVILITKKFMTAFAFAQKMIVGELTRTTISGQPGQKTEQTGAMEQLFTCEMAIHSPRALADGKTLDNPLNEPSALLVIDGDLEQFYGIAA